MELLSPILLQFLFRLSLGIGLAVGFILENMSKRLADTIREEAEGLTPKLKDVEEAAAAVVARIREMEAEGQIFLTAEAEDEEE